MILKPGDLPFIKVQELYLSEKEAYGLPTAIGGLVGAV